MAAPPAPRLWGQTRHPSRAADAAPRLPGQQGPPVRNKIKSGRPHCTPFGYVFRALSVPGSQGPGAPGPVARQKGSPCAVNAQNTSSTADVTTAVSPLFRRSRGFCVFSLKAGATESCFRVHLGVNYWESTICVPRRAEGAAGVGPVPAFGPGSAASFLSLPEPSVPGCLLKNLLYVKDTGRFPPGSPVTCVVIMGPI